MARIHFARFLPICGLLVILVAGCGGKKDTPTASDTTSGGATTPDKAVQGHLNDPNVPESEKAEIRKHMAPGGQ